MSREKIIDLVKTKFRELGQRGKLTGIEQIDGDILKIFVDGEMFGHFSLCRRDFLPEDDDALCTALADEVGAVAI